MADALDILRQKLTEISQLLSTVNTKLGKVTAESVRFNPTAGGGGQWMGNVSGGPTGSSFLSKASMNPVNALAQNAVSQGIMQATVQIREMGKQAGLSGKEVNEFVGRLKTFSSADLSLGTKDWIKTLQQLDGVLATTVGELQELINLRKQLNTQTREPLPTTEPAQPNGVPIPPGQAPVVPVEEVKLMKNELKQSQIAAARNMERYQQAFSMLDKQATGLGFDPSKMRIQASTELTTGYTRMTADLGNVNGVAQKATVSIDRLGNATADTQRRFRSFGDAVKRDMVEFLKWSIAAAAIYGAFQKLSQMIGLMIKNQSELANITVVLGKAQTDTNQIFQDAADIANKTGESISGVLEGYTLAYRATGNLGTISEKTAVANKLMADSLTLSSLSGMSQAEALDSLVASLKQTNSALTDGTILLDKWVKTTRVANVDLQTLATGFAIVGDSAAAAGLSVDELNGLLAAIAETGIASGKEVANAARAIISGFESDTAQKALSKLGIALEDASGQARQFQSIMEELHNLRITGIISDQEFSKLTLALGGGYRRQAVYSTLIENYNRVGEVATQSMSAGGEASEALSIKLNTVAKSVTRLGNAFQELAQGLGSENGALGVINALVIALTSLVKWTGEFTKLAGGSLIPTLATLGTMWAISGKNTGIGQMGQNFANPFIRVASRVPGWNQMPGQETGLPTGPSRAQTVGSQAAGLTGGILLATVLPTLINSLNTGKVDLKGAGTSLAGATVGGMVGLLGGPQGAIIGSMIGSTLATTFVNAIDAQKVHLKDIWADVVIPPEKGGKPTTPEDITAVEKKLSAMIDSFLGKPFVNLPGQKPSYTNKPLTTEETMGYLKPVYGEDWAKKQQEILAKGGIFSESQTQIAKALQAEKEFGRKLPEDMLKLIESLKPPEVQAIEITSSQRAFQEKYAQYIQETINTTNDTITKDLSTGDLAKAAASSAKEAMTGFNTKFAQWGPTLRDAFAGMADKQFVEMIANIVAYSPQDVQDQISAFINTAETWEQLAKWASKFAPAALAAYANKMSAQQKGYATSLTTFANQQALTGIAPMQQLDMSKIAPQNIDQLLKGMVDNLKTYYTQQAGYSETDTKTQTWVDALMTDLKPFMVMTENGFQIKELPASISSLWSNLYDETKKQTGIMEQNVGYQLGGMTEAQYAAIQGQYNAIRAGIINARGTSEETPQVVMFDDQQFSLQTKDWKIIQYLLGQIADNTKKQLEGIYNMPEGASFWFPSSAIPYIQNAASQGGLSGADQAVITNAINASALNAKDQQKLAQTQLIRQNERLPIGPDTEDYTKFIKNILNNPAIGTGTPPAPTPPLTPNDQMVEALDTALATLSSLFNSVGTPPPSGTGGQPYIGTPEDLGKAIGESAALGLAVGKENKLPTLNTKIELTSHVQLIADGRTLASIVAPWLGEFLTNFNGSSTGTTITAVIGGA